MTAARRFFVEGAQAVGNAVDIRGSDAQKIARVLRLRPGDRLEIIDSTATTFSASIEQTGSTIRATLRELINADNRSSPASWVDVAQAVPKGRRMDFVIEKGTELGARAFLPFYSERSVTRKIGSEKLSRWRRLARSSAQQSGRRELPQIHEPVAFNTLVERFGSYGAVLFAWELASQIPLAETVRAVFPASGGMLIVVGPEGGFTHAEADAAVTRGATLVSLGPRILRTDTAAIALLAVIGAFAS